MRPPSRAPATQQQNASGPALQSPNRKQDPPLQHRSVPGTHVSNMLTQVPPLATQAPPEQVPATPAIDEDADAVVQAPESFVAWTEHPPPLHTPTVHVLSTEEQSTPAHKGSVATQAPPEQVPAAPAAVVQAPESLELVALQTPPLQTPTVHALSKKEQSTPMQAHGPVPLAPSARH